MAECTSYSDRSASSTISLSRRSERSLSVLAARASASARVRSRSAACFSTSARALSRSATCCCASAARRAACAWRASVRAMLAPAIRLPAIRHAAEMAHRWRRTYFHERYDSESCRAITGSPARWRRNLAAAAEALEDGAAAERCYRRALAIKGKLLGEDHPEWGLTANNLAVLLNERGQREEAARLLQQAAAVMDARLETGHPLREFRVEGSSNMAEATTQQAVTRLLLEWREGIDRALMHGIPRSRRDDATPGSHFNQAPRHHD
jgi:tetratricopeptide (TPR) repeat protein